MKLYFEQSSVDDSMVCLIKKNQNSGKKNLFAVVHEDFLIDKEFGGNQFDIGSVLNRIDNGETLVFDLKLQTEQNADV